jgi:regulator of protease activity HflC (stomatin/prohibitin superfamily)
VVVQRMGGFQRVAGAGINFKLPWLDLNAQIDAPGDLSSLRWMWETKTKDKRVRQDVKIPVSVEYHVIADKVYEAF